MVKFSSRTLPQTKQNKPSKMYKCCVKTISFSSLRIQMGYFTLTLTSPMNKNIQTRMRNRWFTAMKTARIIPLSTSPRNSQRKKKTRKINFHNIYGKAVLKVRDSLHLFHFYIPRYFRIVSMMHVNICAAICWCFYLFTGKENEFTRKTEDSRDFLPDKENYLNARVCHKEVKCFFI